MPRKRHKNKHRKPHFEIIDINKIEDPIDYYDVNIVIGKMFKKAIKQSKKRSTDYIV